MAKTFKRSPLAPAGFPGFEPIAGVRMATARAGIKYADRTDVLLMAFDAGTVAAGVLTRSRCPGAPVEWCREILRTPSARGLVVNSGNANAFTGEKGRQAARRTAELGAQALGCGEDEIFLASTGVIGEPLDAEKFVGVLPEAAERLVPGGFEEAARAIMTTDTFPKGAFAAVPFGEGVVRIGGIAKGSGMIAPDMATTLGFVVTDAPIAQPILQTLLSELVTETFNAITVDSDTSTSDTLLSFATGQASDVHRLTDGGDARLDPFRAALRALLLDLACQVVRDGEGATKFITVEVTGAETAASARTVALAIANSPLVKTAVAGGDANWGRVVMAVGKSGEPVDRDRLAIHFGQTCVAENGARHPSYDEAAASAHVAGDDVYIRVDLGMGNGNGRVYTCDLTNGYIEINGNYRS